MDPAAVAALWHELMTEGLGYERFGAQGGDWGATVATRLAMLRPEAVAGIHLNYLPGSYTPWLEDGPILSAAEREFLAGQDAWLETRRRLRAHPSDQAADRRVRLARFAVGAGRLDGREFRDWADCGGDLSRRFHPDEILAMVTLYWVTGTIGSSMRLYREAAAIRSAWRAASGWGCRRVWRCFRRRSRGPPREWAERGYDVWRWEEMARGGHFAAWEEPVLLAGEIRRFFRDLRT